MVPGIASSASSASFASGHAGRIRHALGEAFDRVATQGADYRSLLLVGGIGFGDFNPAASDVDTWIVQSDAEPLARLQAAKRNNGLFSQAKQELIGQGVVAEHNFRHPPSFFTESEAATYQVAFPAKVGLPIALGVFPTIRGVERKGTPVYTEEQLRQDLAYSCHAFYKNVVEPPSNGREDIARYCFKRAGYFMRFKLFYDTGTYAAGRQDVLAAGEQLPEWRPLLPALNLMQEQQALPASELSGFQQGIRLAMEKGLERYRNDQVLDEGRIARGGLRTGVQWTLEKLRWDYLLMPRHAAALWTAMTDGPEQVWGFAFSRIDALLKNIGRAVGSASFCRDWERFGVTHNHTLAGLQEAALATYYDETYHPELLKFFDRTAHYMPTLF
ncbi:MAG TPA: hypothetical protein VFK47_19950 [Ktedonobacteraceae bacterium]|nr:hypothetical protein [Ktedonobacteraceae bacterium]